MSFMDQGDVAYDVEWQSSSNDDDHDDDYYDDDYDYDGLIPSRRSVINFSSSSSSGRSRSSGDRRRTGCDGGYEGNVMPLRYNAQLHRKGEVDDVELRSFKASKVSDVLDNYMTKVRKRSGGL